MPLGRVVVQHADVAHDLHARCLHGHQDHAVAVVAVVVAGVVSVCIAAHHDEQPAVRVRRAGDEPLAATEHEVVTVAPHRGLQVGRVGRSHVGLAHRKGRAQAPLQQRHQPRSALRGCGKPVQQLDVAGVGRVAVEHLGRPGQTAHGLGQRRVVEVAQPRAGLIGAQPGQEQVPQTLLARQGLEVFQKRRWIVARQHRRMPGRVVGQQIAVHERNKALTPLAGKRRRCEVHGAL